jgi:hypothetical protein
MDSPKEEPSKPLKAATQALCGTVETLLKSREELQVIHDNHSELVPSANQADDNNKNYNSQQGARATSPPKRMKQVLRFQTNLDLH